MQIKEIAKQTKSVLRDFYHIHKNAIYLHSINSKKSKDIINVVFICQPPSLWNSIRTVYQEACRNPLFKTFLIAIPEKDFDKDGIHFTYGKNNSYTYLKDNGFDVIEGYQNGNFIDIKSLKPDYVFLPRPYDQHLPDEYKSNALVKYTRVCYVPYGFSLTNDCMPTIFNYSFLKNTYLFFPDSFCAKNYVNALYKKKLCKWNKIGNIGFPRFDLLNQQLIKKRCKSFLWTPRWTTQKESCGSTFFLFIDKLLDFFIEHEDLELIFRPHPLLFRNFLATGELSQEKYDSILKAFDEHKNLILNDPVEDYIKVFNDVDAMITDPTSLLPEFFYTGKPIIYCDTSEAFNEAGLVMAKGLYYASNWEQIMENINKLASGEDALLKERSESLHKLNSSKNIGKQICDFLISDFFQTK